MAEKRNNTSLLNHLLMKFQNNNQVKITPKTGNNMYLQLIHKKSSELQLGVEALNKKWEW